MLILLSPAKTLDETPKTNQGTELPKFRKKTLELAGILKDYPPKKLKSLMHISDKLAELNHKRYQDFSSRYTPTNSKAAIYAFRGDVYVGLQADTMDKKDLEFAQKHLRILSGFYGLLRPMDKMQPYRLEMGTSLKNEKGSNLYDFWQDTITKEINASLKANGNNLLINLASNEYYKAVLQNKLKAEVLNIGFKEYRDEKLKFISFSAKKARGLMSQYIIKNKITQKEDLKGFDYEGYMYKDDLSTSKEYMFVR